MEDLQKKAFAYDELQSKAKVLNEAFNRLKEVKKTVEKVNVQLENLEDTVKKDLEKKGVEITKKANELMAYSYSHLYGLKTTGLRFFTVYGPWG